MTSAQIRLNLERMIENMNPSSLKKIYGLMVNYFNSKQTLEEWAAITDAEKAAIEEGLAQLNKGKRTSRTEAMSAFRKRYR